VFFNATVAANNIDTTPTTSPNLGKWSSSAISRFQGDLFTEFEKPTDNLKMAESSQSTSMEVTDETIKKNNKRKSSTDEDGFIHPGRVTRQRHAKFKVLANNGIITNNEYEKLSDNESELDDHVSEVPSQSSYKPPRKFSESTPKPPKPIYVSSSSFVGAKNLLTSLNLSKIPDFKIVGKQIKVLAHTKDDKKKIQEKMTQSKQHHYTFTEPEDRHLQFVLYGHYANDVTELKEELVAAKIPATKVTKVNHSLRNPVFLISFEKTSEISL
jgi:hypothetical protein